MPKLNRLVKKILKALGILLIEWIIPFSLSMWFFWKLVEWFNLWKFQQNYWFFFIYICIVAGGATVSGIVLNRIIEWQNAFRKHPITKSHTSKSRKRLRILIANILLPLLTTLIVALLPISGDTVLTRFIRYLSNRGEYFFLNKVCDTVVRAENIETKLAGIETLEIIHSKKCLDELFEILKRDEKRLEDIDFYTGMTIALASFEGKAISPLLSLFEQAKQKTLSLSTGSQSALYDQYFKNSFRKLNEDVNDLSLRQEKTSELQLRLQQLELNVKQNLKDVEFIEPNIIKRNTIFDFVFSAFLEMKELRENQQIYNIAMTSLGNASMSTETQAKALLLIGKLGSEKDFKTLIPYLDHYNEEIKTAALQAIATLHVKISGEKRKKELKPKFIHYETIKIDN